MKILTVHNHYALRGGEDEVQVSERDLLRRHGHDVEEYLQENSDIKGARPWEVAARSVWSQEDYRAVRSRLRAQGTDLMVVHNFFPLISPSVYYAARAEGVPVVQTLHNFRLICPSAFLLRDGAICEDCVTKPLAYPGIIHACYRSSRLLSAGVAGTMAIHRMAGTWNHLVDRYVALTPFMRNMFIKGGLPEDKISVKPNFTPDVGTGEGKGGYFLFVGRLSYEKGISVLLEAWKLAKTDMTLRIIGTGPDELSLKAQALSLRNVQFLGSQPKERVLDEMREASALIMPSLWYEGFGLVIIEAFSVGTPVLASNLGAMASLVEDGRTGYLFEAGNARQLADLLDTWEERPNLRAAARERYLRAYTPEVNYLEMVELYSSVIAQRSPEGRSV